MNPGTVAEALPRLAQGMNLDADRDRAEVIRGLNHLREYLYNAAYHNVRLFEDVVDCVRVDCFPVECRRLDCCESPNYQGFTALPHWDGILASFYNRESITQRSFWFETRHGISVSDQSPVTLQERPGFVPFRFKFVSGKIRIYTESTGDHGKIVTLSGTDNQGRQAAERVSLMGDGSTTTATDWLSVDQVILPASRTGRVDFLQDDKMLSQYSPMESPVPQYRRYEVLNVDPCDPCPHVRIIANRKFYPVWWDTDFVEVVDSLLLHDAGVWLRYRDSTDSKERKNADEKLQSVLRLVTGAKQRGRAGVTQDQPHFRTKNTYRLPGHT
jgi:hypothetical protein